MLDKLQKYGISDNIINELRYFRKYYKTDDSVINRIQEPKSFYYGIDVWEQCLYALLNSQNILLVGTKATGKNILADNLAYAFARTKWTVSFHNFLDADDLIGVDTYKNSQVVFRNGSISECSIYGGFGILDEINMAKNDAISVLYSALDYRRVIDISGYKKIDISEPTRFIATMNYGYYGTKELNEALISRFAVIQMPKLNKDMIFEILKGSFTNINEDSLQLLSEIFENLQTKAQNGQISSKAVDLRGLIDAVSLAKKGMNISKALQICITNKVFDEYERQIISALIKLKLSNKISLAGD